MYCIFLFVTTSYIYKFLHILIGSPTSSISKLVSGSITDLAALSILLPIQFFLYIPSFLVAI